MNVPHQKLYPHTMFSTKKTHLYLTSYRWRNNKSTKSENKSKPNTKKHNKSKTPFLWIKIMNMNLMTIKMEAWTEWYPNKCIKKGPSSKSPIINPITLDKKISLWTTSEDTTRQQASTKLSFKTSWTGKDNKKNASKNLREKPSNNRK